jgi:hypothetical protein
VPYEPKPPKLSIFSGDLQRLLKPIRPAKSKSDSRALETKGSNLQKVLNFIGRPGNAERQALINQMQGKSWVAGLKAGITGKASPTGGDVIQAFRGGRAPENKAGKIAQGVGGFAADVLNPLDPINLVGGGIVKAGSKALQLSGKLAPFAQGLIKGERALLGIRIPFTQKSIPLTPDFINRAAGHTLTGVGRAAMTVPGVASVVKGMRPSFKKLSTFMNIGKSRAGHIEAEHFEKFGKIQKPLADRAVGQIKAGKLSPALLKHYAGLTPEQIVGREVRHFLEKPILASQKKNGITSITGGKKFKNSVSEFLKTVERPDAPMLPAIRGIARMQEKSLGILGGMKKSRGIEGEALGYAPRVLSEESRKQMKELGINVEKGDRVFKDLTTSQIEALAKEPKYSSKLFSEIVGSKGLEKNPQLLDAFRKKNPAGASFYEDDAVKAYGTHLKSSSKEVAASEAVESVVKNPSFARASKEAWGENANRVVAVPVPERFKFPLRAVKGEPRLMQGGKVWVDETVAPEFRRLTEVLSDADKVNQFLATNDTMWKTLTQLWKRSVLYSPPGSVPTIMRNFTGNNFLSWIRGAWSVGGFSGASKAMATILKHGDNPKAFAEATANMGQLGQELRLMKAGNLFEEGLAKDVFEGARPLKKIEGLVGINLGGKANEAAENFSRVQHYLTRRAQGYTPEAAIEDVRESLYDYVNGLPPALQRFKNSPAGMPFVSWMYFNIPAMVEQALKHPGKAMSIDRAKKNFEAAQGDHPDERALAEYIKGDLNVRLWMDPKTGKWTYLRLKGTLPIADLEDVTSMSKFYDLMLASLNPITKTTLENTFNRSLFFKSAGGERSPIENYPGETSEFLRAEMPKKLINVLRNLRPLGEINKIIPSKGGAPKLSGGEYGLRMTGLSLVPSSPERDAQKAREAFQKRLSDLKRAKRTQEFYKKPTSGIDEMMRRLREEESFSSPSQRKK